MIDDLYWFHEVVDELHYKEAVTLECVNKYISWMTNVNDGLIWYRYRITETEQNNKLINSHWAKHKLKRYPAYIQNCLEWLHSIHYRRRRKGNNEMPCIDQVRHCIDFHYPCHDLKDLNIFASLTDLHRFTSDYTQIRNIDALSLLTNLQHLSISHSSIEDFYALASLTNLHKLEITHNRNFEDISVLAHCTRLEDLNVTHTSIHDITVHSKLTCLKHIDLSFTNIYDINPLTSLTSLCSLSLRKANINDINGLSSLTNITYLSLDLVPTDNITPLVSLTNLTSIELAYTNITDISMLATCTKLRDLTINNSQMNISMLMTFPELTFIYIVGQLSDANRQLLEDREIEIKCVNVTREYYENDLYFN